MQHESTMALSISTARIGTPKRPGEGLRLGTVRYLPRGVKKTDYARHNLFDVWLPNLAPSRKLLQSFKDEGLTVGTFFSRYRHEMRATEPRQLIALLARVAQQTPLSIGCYCEDETRCHRSVLIELIRAAANE